MSLLLERVQNTLDSVREVSSTLSCKETNFPTYLKLSVLLCRFVNVKNYFASGMCSFIPSLAGRHLETKDPRHSGNQKLASSLTS